MPQERAEEDVQAFIDTNFAKCVIEPLSEFIKIPNVSRAYDPEWETNGLMDRACEFVIEHAKSQGVEDFSIELIKEEGKPNIVLAIADKKDAPTVLLYGHIDKQPPLTNLWREGLHPYKPVIEDGKLYGRGGADDGYAFFASLFIVKALQKFGLQKHRFVLFFECDEESGSRDLVYFLKKNLEKIGEPSVMVCLDSGTVDYEHFSLTTSLRGMITFELKVEVTSEGLHSGQASGIVPDTFRIARDLLARFEDTKTGQVIPELFVNIPKDKYEQACQLIDEVGSIDFKIPFLEGVRPVTEDPLQVYLNRTWRPQSTVIGFEGLPGPKICGSVLNPSTTYIISCRLPPTLAHEQAAKTIEDFFAAQKPLYNAKLSFRTITEGTGLNVNPFSDKMARLLNEAADKFYGKIPLFMGEGMSIPFLNSFQQIFPKAEFLVAGVLGPGSNAHGPNEFIDLKFAQRLTQSFVHIFRNY